MTVPTLDAATAGSLIDPFETELARRHLFEFTAYTFPEYKPSWHHEVLCEYLDAFARKEILRLMVFMPPRHGKSEHVSRRLPAKLLGDDPNARIISASYNADLASAMNRDVQRIIESEQYARLYPLTRLNSKNIRTFASGGALRNSDIFEVVGYRGYYKSTGIGGGITGRGFNYGLIDDPIKDRAEAESDTYRQKLWEWYTSVFYTRKQKNASILLTVTRWHEDDLAGRLIRLMKTERKADQWTMLTLPAVNEDGPAEAELPAPPDERAQGQETITIQIDPRQPGEALWPNEYGLDDLEKTKATLTEYEWLSLYQQTPISKEGGLYKVDRINIIPRPPTNIIKIGRFWDLALSEKTSADWTVGLLGGLTSAGRIVLLDMIRQQIDYDELEKLIVDTIIADGPKVTVGIESVFLQVRIVRKVLKHAELLEYTIHGVGVENDKFTRALPIAARVGNGFVDMVEQGWNVPLIAELRSFPKGLNDDISDAVAGLNNLLDKAPLLAEPIDVMGYGRSLTLNGVSVNLNEAAQTVGRDLYRQVYEQSRRGLTNRESVDKRR